MQSRALAALAFIAVTASLGGVISGPADAGNPGPQRPPPPAPSSSTLQLDPVALAAVASAGKGLVIPPRVEDVEQMCALILGCPDSPLPVGRGDFGACVRHFWSTLSNFDTIRSSLTVRECGLGAISCSQFVRCAMRGASPTACEGRGIGESTPVGRCDIDGRALECLEGKVVGVRDCPRGGELCMQRRGQSYCVAGTCSLDAGTESKAHCAPDATRIVQCMDQRQVSVSCAALGLQCVHGANGQPACTSKTAPACTNSTPRCDGMTAVGCLDGREIRVDCAQAQLTCGVGVSGTALIGACATSPYGSDKECDPARFPTTCVGDEVRYCAGGTERRFKCKTAFGLSRCVGQAGRAHCE